MIPDRWESVWQLLNGWQRVELVALLLCAIGQTAFVVVYTFRPWPKFDVGRALWSKSALIAIVLWMSVIANFYVYPIEDALGTVVLCLLCCSIWYQLYVLVHTPNRWVVEPQPAEEDTI